MSKTKIYVIHGYTASPSANWFPSLKEALESKTVEVIIPEMPNPHHPRYAEWMDHLEATIEGPDENTVLIGHSLGCVSLLNYLNNDKTRRVGGLFLISGFVEETPLPALTGFMQSKLDYDRLIGQADIRMAISAKDDDIIPFGYSEKMAEKLKTEFTLLDEGGHFIDRDGFTEFPYLVQEVKKQMAI